MKSTRKEYCRAVWQRYGRHASLSYQGGHDNYNITIKMDRAVLMREEAEWVVTLTTMQPAGTWDVVVAGSEFHQ